MPSKFFWLKDYANYLDSFMSCWPVPCCRKKVHEWGSFIVTEHLISKISWLCGLGNQRSAPQSLHALRNNKVSLSPHTFYNFFRHGTLPLMFGKQGTGPESLGFAAHPSWFLRAVIRFDISIVPKSLAPSLEILPGCSVHRAPHFLGGTGCGKDLLTRAWGIIGAALPPLSSF